MNQRPNHQFGKRSFFKEAHHYHRDPSSNSLLLDRSILIEKRIFHPTILHAIHHNATIHPDDVYATWIDARGKISYQMTYKQLLNRALAIKDHLLQDHKLHKGDRVMIAYPFGLRFLDGFFGCMLAGVIPCSVYPPNPHKGNAKFSFDQFNTQVTDAGAKIALTTQKFSVLMKAASLRGLRTKVEWVPTDALANKAANGSRTIAESDLPEPESIAFIQYSSGSTSVPKGVVLSHHAVAHNQFTSNTTTLPNYGHYSRCVSWLPQYHDFGLNILLAPAYSGRVQTFAFSPVDFIKNPLLWADVMDKFKATYTGGPNFGYALLAKRMKAAARALKNGHLLSRVQIGAEPIAPDTLDRMKEIGIPASALLPSYGMAECSVFASSSCGSEVTVLDGLVSCGTIERNEAFDKYLVIADSDRKICHEGIVGEIHIRGPDLASGYWAKPQLDERFHIELDDGHEYFATGDLGMIVEGKLFVVGRTKELIIVNGKNIYPTDVERTIESELNEVRPGCSAAFQLVDNKIGVVLEQQDGSCLPSDHASNIRNLVADVHGVDISALVVLRKGNVPKTTSGKLRRLEAQKRTAEKAWNDKEVVWSWSEDEHGATSEARDVLTSTTLDKSASCRDIFMSVLGPDMDMSKTWEENGLSSMRLSELADRLSDSFPVTLPANYTELYPTPSHLETFIEGQIFTPFPKNIIDLSNHKTSIDTGPLPIPIVCFLQAVGIVVHMALVILSAGPSYYMIRHGHALPRDVDLPGGNRITWSWLPIVVPVFMAVYSIIALLMKWMVIGRYRQTEVDVYSVRYLRWWFVDRGMHIWEFCVGRFVFKTIIGRVFYVLMGGKIDLRANLDAMVREFDLVSVGARGAINTEIRCRMFGVWRKGSTSPTMRFRRVEVGQDCTIDGMLCPGVKVGDGSILTKLAVAVEGAQIPEGRIASGNPALNAGPVPTKTKNFFSIWLEVVKVVWLFIEAYIFFTVWFAASAAWTVGLSSMTWRYTGLLFWFLTFWTSQITLVMLSIVLKWLFIGKRSPGKEKTLFSRIADFICDYHADIANLFLYSMTGFSKIWNMILWCQGLDTDMFSSIDIQCFPPSKVHLAKIKRSFVAKGTSVRDTVGVEKKTEIIESSVGYRVAFAAGTHINRTKVRPQVFVDQDIIGDDTRHKVSFRRLLALHAFEFVTLVMFVVLFWTLVPVYECALLLSDHSKMFVTSATGIVALVAIQSLIWSLFFRLLQSVAAYSTEAFGNPGLYVVYIRCGKPLPNWCFWWILWGTPFYQYVLRFMGSKVEGRVVYHGGTPLQDFHSLTFADRTVIDDGKAIGHMQVYDKMTFGRTRVAGLLQPGCIVIPGCSLKDEQEINPWRLITRTEETEREKADDEEQAV